MSNEEAFRLFCKEHMQTILKDFRDDIHSLSSPFFSEWWDIEGSSLRPLENEDVEEFARRITWIAWTNGAYKAVLNYPEGGFPRWWDENGEER